MENDAFVAFARGRDHFDAFCTGKGVKNVQIKQQLAQINETHLGILFFMKKHWNCEKKVQKQWKLKEKKWDEYKRYRKFLDILYEYLRKVNAGHNDAKRPKFIERDSIILRLRNTIAQTQKFGSVVEKLSKIFKAYLCAPAEKNGSERRIDLLPTETGFDLDYWENYEEKAKKNKTKVAESDQDEFDKIMGETFEKVMEKAKLMKKGQKNDGQLAKAKTETENAITMLSAFALHLPKYQMCDAIEDEAFLELVKKEKNNYLQIMEQIGITPKPFDHYYYEYYIGYRIKKKKVKNFELCQAVLYLMKTEWNCANATNDFGNDCEKLRRYLDILYEYLFKVRYGIPAVKPMFHRIENQRLESLTLASVLDLLYEISKSLFGTNSTEDELAEELAKAKEEASNLTLTNEDEVKAKAKTDKKGNSKMTLHESGVRVAIDAKSTAEKETKASSFNGLLRPTFDNELKEMLNKWRKMASDEKRKLEELRKEIDERAEQPMPEMQIYYNARLEEYVGRFFPLLFSPFPKKLRQF